MKHAIKLTAILASLTLLTGCGAFNTSEQTAEYNAPITDAPATVPADSDSEEVADCCGDSLDCCSDSDSDCCEKKSETAAPEKAELNLGYLNSTAHLLAFVAAEEGYFAEEGLNVTLTQFSSAGELVNGLESGKLDLAFIGSVPTLTFQSQGHDVTIVGGAMTNGHGYVIKPEYAEEDELGVEILKGRNVASVKNSVQDAELQILLKDAGMSASAIADAVGVSRHTAELWIRKYRNRSEDTDIEELLKKINLPSGCCNGVCQGKSEYLCCAGTCIPQGVSSDAGGSREDDCRCQEVH